MSACETAVGDNRATLGLAGVAVKAGAQSTLASLWKVKDSSTAVLMGEFYRELNKGNISKAEALRLAQMKLMKEYSNYSAPLYWAPFILVGNWL
jgi:CHAT domain-containing protein